MEIGASSLDNFQSARIKTTTGINFRAIGLLRIIINQTRIFSSCLFQRCEHFIFAFQQRVVVFPGAASEQNGVGDVVITAFVWREALLKRKTPYFP